jgi:PhoH-like ATPase
MKKIKKFLNRLFVLDTNVLMHDPSALLRFHEHDVYLPMIVLEELDNNKKGLTETARNVRQVNRFLDDLMQNKSHQEIVQGLQLPSAFNHENELIDRGRLFFQTNEIHIQLPNVLPGTKSDNTILGVTLALQKEYSKLQVTLVSKDINLRVKAGIIGIHAEDYYNDRVLEDMSELHTGMHALPKDFWEKHSKNLESWREEGKTYYKIVGPDTQQWFPNDCLYLEGDQPFTALVRQIKESYAIIEHAHDYQHPKHNVWGINARNREQNFALNLLMDPEIDFVTLQGPAGTGKTLLTLAAGLAQTMDHTRYREIIMTRVTVPLGEDIGFLPGTEEEKMTPWMGALMDNLEVLHSSQHNDSWERAATQDLLRHRIKIRSLNFMRGRTFLNKYIIIDEAQNLTSKQVKTLLTRAGPGTKIICLGDLKQIDTPYLSETTSGLTYAIDRFRNWSHSAHITLSRGERSRLADFASEHL